MANRLSEQEVLGVFEKVSNWGRWGKDDERGALNFITDKQRAAAANGAPTGRYAGGRPASGGCDQQALAQSIRRCCAHLILSSRAK